MNIRNAIILLLVLAFFPLHLAAQGVVIETDPWENNPDWPDDPSPWIFPLTIEHIDCDIYWKNENVNIIHPTKGQLYLTLGKTLYFGQNNNNNTRSVKIWVKDATGKQFLFYGAPVAIAADLTLDDMISMPIHIVFFYTENGGGVYTFPGGSGKIHLDEVPKYPCRDSILGDEVGILDFMGHEFTMVFCGDCYKIGLQNDNILGTLPDPDAPSRPVGTLRPFEYGPNGKPISWIDDDGNVWLDSDGDGVADCYLYENGEWEHAGDDGWPDGVRQSSDTAKPCPVPGGEDPDPGTDPGGEDSDPDPDPDPDEWPKAVDCDDDGITDYWLFENGSWELTDENGRPNGTRQDKDAVKPCQPGGGEEDPDPDPDDKYCGLTCKDVISCGPISWEEFECLDKNTGEVTARFLVSLYLEPQINWENFREDCQFSQQIVAELLAQNCCPKYYRTIDENGVPSEEWYEGTPDCDMWGGDPDEEDDEGLGLSEGEFDGDFKPPGLSGRPPRVQVPGWIKAKVQSLFDAFSRRGHEAWSCDLLPGETPGNHYQGDVFEILDDNWDLVIAHPPCTDLAVSGNAWMSEKIKDGRQQAAIEFFMRIIGCTSPRLCVENPVGVISTRFRRPTQYIQPWQFGHTETKKTGLWLRWLPPLKPTNIVEPEFVYSQSGRKYSRITCMGRMEKEERWKRRSVTYLGIAEAMAAQWG